MLWGWETFLVCGWTIPGSMPALNTVVLITQIISKNQWRENNDLRMEQEIGGTCHFDGEVGGNLSLLISLSSASLFPQISFNHWQRSHLWDWPRKKEKVMEMQNALQSVSLWPALFQSRNQKLWERLSSLMRKTLMYKRKRSMPKSEQVNAAHSCLYQLRKIVHILFKPSNLLSSFNKVFYAAVRAAEASQKTLKSTLLWANSALLLRDFAFYGPSNSKARNHLHK